MLDFGWLATEAKTIYLLFGNLFYAMISFLLITGVLLEFFKFPIGGLPSFGPLVGRCFIAAIMFISFPEFLIVPLLQKKNKSNLLVVSVVGSRVTLPVTNDK